MEQWKKIGTFDIMNNISKYATLVQLMDSVCNVNNAITVVGKWIFGLNYENSLLLNLDSLNLICGYSEEDGYFVKF